MPSANVTIQLSVVGYRSLAKLAVDYRPKPISAVKPQNMRIRISVGNYAYLESQSQKIRYISLGKNGKMVETISKQHFSKPKIASTSQQPWLTRRHSRLELSIYMQ